MVHFPKRTSTQSARRSMKKSLVAKLFYDKDILIVLVLAAENC